MATKEYSFYPGCSSDRNVSASNSMVSVEAIKGMRHMIDVLIEDFGDDELSAPSSICQWCSTVS
ncbi:MAG: hypothetical protein WBM41_19180 [Arenicellales bacterium]